MTGTLPFRRALGAQASSAPLIEDVAGQRPVDRAPSTGNRGHRSSISPPVVASGISDTQDSISAEVRDAITDAVMVAPGRAGRADVICGLLGEAFGSVHWLSGQERADDEELASLGRLVAAAHDHHARMAATSLVRAGAR